MNKRKSLLLALFFCSSFFCEGQVNPRKTDGPAFYANNFLKYASVNADSALHFIRLLASNTEYEYSLQNIIHNQFAQVFQEKMYPPGTSVKAVKNEHEKKVEIGYQIVSGMLSDMNERIVNAATPINYWIQVQQNKDDTAVLYRLANQFIKTQLVNKDIYPDRTGRYALLIHRIISQRKELQTLSEQFFITVYNRFQSGQVELNADVQASRLLLEKRTWFRYHFAYCNYIKAIKLAETRRNNEAGDYYKIAFEYSPDLTDKNNNSNAYFYDMHFLFNTEKKGFHEDYLNHLISNDQDKNKILSTLLSIALKNPIHIQKLKSYYETNFLSAEPFLVFWKREFNMSLRTASEFSLKLINGSEFSTAANTGKWVLIDFWGTWCAPCRKEHPDLQKFYNEVVLMDTARFALLTISCKDELSDVNAYLTKYNYGFPVAMSDTTIENLFTVNSYPTKILITPEGKYMYIPLDKNWRSYIAKLTIW